MPGANCSIFGCSTLRKHCGTAISKVPSSNDEFNKIWREKLVSAITRDRVIDKSLRHQINDCRLYVCEKHFTEDQLVQRKYCQNIYWKILHR